MKPHKVRWPRSALAAALLAGGCAKILGFNEPTEVTCVTSSDCAAGFACVEFVCECVGDCGGGDGGTGGSGAAAGTDSFVRAGMGATGAGRGGTGGTEPSMGGAGGDGSGGEDGGRGGAGGSAAMTDGGAGSGGDGGAGSGGIVECDPSGTSLCFACDDEGNYEPGSPCEAACVGDRVCTTPRSCNGLATKCSGANCCLSLPVPGDEFLRSCDDDCRRRCEGASEGFPARISSLFLDAFEVTVGRFRRFVAQYPGSIPDPGDGANERNSMNDPGWQAEWTEFLPVTQDDLKTQLASGDLCAAEATWTSSAADNEALPINCVTWYMAQAFCVWDGGRLPTNAEWNLVAAGGSEARVFPWTKPEDEPVIDETYAVFDWGVAPPIGPDDVGSREAGRGKWGHYDLAGNVAEWVWDGRENCYPTPDECDDCGVTLDLDSKVTRGGSFMSPAPRLLVETQIGNLAMEAVPYLGFRCARDL